MCPGRIASDSGALFGEREDAYTRVLSQIQLQQQHVATDLDDKKRHFDRLAADRDDTEALLNHEVMDWDSIDKLRKRDVMKRNLLPLLGILAGTGMAIAGSVTGLIPLAGAGIGVGFTSALKINFSRKPTPDASLGKKTSNFMLEPLCSGGQGAAGASLN